MCEKLVDPYFLLKHLNQRKTESFRKKNKENQSNKPTTTTTEITKKNNKFAQTFGCVQE